MYAVYAFVHVLSLFLASRLPKSALKFARFYILCHREVPKNVHLKALMYMSERAV